MSSVLYVQHNEQKNVIQLCRVNPNQSCHVLMLSLLAGQVLVFDTPSIGSRRQPPAELRKDVELL